MSFNQEDIKKTTANIDENRLISFGNQIINMKNVEFIELVYKDKKDNQPRERAIVFHFTSGRSFRQDYHHTVHMSHGWRTLHYCIENNVFAVEFSQEMYSRLDKIATQASD